MENILLRWEDIVIENYPEESLFPAESYHNPEYYRYKLALVPDCLPALPYGAPVPSFEVWHEDGVPFMANSWGEVAKRLAGIQDDADIAPEMLLQTYDAFMENGEYGKAKSLTYGAKELDANQADFWQQKELEASLTYLRLGLAESTMLPFSQWDEESYTAQSHSPVKVKHFLEFYSLAMSLAQDYPEEAAPYLDYADGLHMELLLGYPGLGEYTHQMWKFWGSDAEAPSKASVYNRIKAKDQDWRDRATHIVCEQIRRALHAVEFGRAGVLSYVGRATELVSADFVKSQFLNTYHQLDLHIELPNHLGAMNSIIVPHQYPRLTNFRSMVQELWQGDPDLRRELDSIMAQREVEALQRMLAAPDRFDARMIRLLKEELNDLAYQLPDNSPQKEPLIATTLESKQEELLANITAVGAATVDRQIEEYLNNMHSGVLDEETVAIYIDQLGMAIAEDAGASSTTHDTFEKIIGYISPLCRQGQTSMERLMSQDITTKIDAVLISLMEQYKHDEYYSKYYRGMLIALGIGPRALFDYYWRLNEEYYT